MRKPITKNSLARLLKPYKIRPGTIRIGPGERDTAKGYKLVQFMDAFARYLPDPPNQTVTPTQPKDSAAFRAIQSVTSWHDVTGENAQNASVSAGCDGVTDVKPVRPGADGADITIEETTWTV
jgi:Protein of unknown function (DUF3631)